MSLMVVSAVRFEAEPTLRMLEERGIACAFQEVGIGPINAAKGEAALARACEGKHVVYLGSCGIFGPFQAPYLCTVREVHWLPTAERLGTARAVEGLHPPMQVPAGILTQGLPAITLLTSPSLSLDPTEACDPPMGENMELYACLPGLITSAKTLDIVLGVTNGVGPQGHEEWVQNFRTVAQMTADYLAQF